MSAHPPYGDASTQHCQRCAKLLALTEVYCNTCGAYNILPEANRQREGIDRHPGQLPSTPLKDGPTGRTSFGLRQYVGQQWDQTPRPPSSQNSFTRAFTPQALDSYQAVQQQAQPPSSTPSNLFAPNRNFYQAPQLQGSPPDSYQALQPPPYSAPLTGPASGFQRSTINGYKPVGLSQWYHQLPPRTIKISLILGIVILLIIGGFGFYITKSTSKTTTSTAISLPAPSGTPLFSDSFQNNTNGWDLTSMAGKFSVTIGGGAMVLEENDHHLLWELLPGGKTYNNFQLAVDTTLSKGDQNNGYGIYIRNSSQQAIDLATYYCFELYGDGTYAIFKGTVDASGTPQKSKLVDFTPNSAIQKVGNLNHLFIIAKGSSMTFMVNGQTLTTITDNSYLGGSVALFVSNLPASPPIAQATFSKLAVYSV